MRVIALSTDVIASSDDIRNQVLAKKQRMTSLKGMSSVKLVQSDWLKRRMSSLQRTDVIPQRDDIRILQPIPSANSSASSSHPASEPIQDETAPHANHIPYALWP